jgi:hypothetical protein
VFMDAPVVPGCVIRSRSGEGNEEGAAIWRQITAAVEELQRKRRPAEAVNEVNLSSCDKCHPLTQRCGWGGVPDRNGMTSTAGSLARGYRRLQHPIQLRPPSPAAALSRTSVRRSQLATYFAAR